MQVQLSTEFALHGLIYLAAQRPREPIQLAEIAAAIKVRESYLRKLFQQMVKVELLEAYKGANGGYRFKLDPERLSFWDVMQAIEGCSGHLRCFAPQRACQALPDCQIQQGFNEAFASFTQHLQKLTVGKLLKSRPRVNHKMVWLQRSDAGLSQDSTLH